MPIKKINPPFYAAKDPERWVKQVMDVIQERIEENDKVWDMTLMIENFPPHQFHFYQLLQQEIAKKIPIEANRPTIHLKIRGANRSLDRHTAPDYAYMGGTGPLSDAAALGGIMAEYHLHKKNKSFDNFSADLFSCPPPRDGKIARTKHYLQTVKNFMSECDSEHFCLLSNTAHLNINKVKKLLILSTAGRKTPKVENLVDKIVSEIGSEQGWEKTGKLSENSHILVCGTDVAHDRQLYPKKFIRKNINSHLPTDKDQLQRLIDSIKGGKVNEPDAAFGNKTPGEELVDFIIEQMQIVGKKTEILPTHLLLSCTELPMGFHTELSPELMEKYKNELPGEPIKTYADLFKAKCKSVLNIEPPVIIDTEHGMVKNIVKKQLKNEQKEFEPPKRATSIHFTKHQSESDFSRQDMDVTSKQKNPRPK